MNKLYTLILSAVLLQSCHLLNKPKTSENTAENTEKTVISPQNKTAPYQASEKKHVDLLHTQLHVRFAWAKQEVYGIANLSIKPYFYPVQNLEIDAQGMQINSVELIEKNGEKKKLNYQNDSVKIKIQLPKKYTRKDTFQLRIDYVARPNLLNKKLNAKIREDKGLYFINPLNKIKDKPMQIWTQGEPEANSCWFPTIDAPNEKMTQELYITVDERFKTLSNGVLVKSTKNNDGTKTDYWKQTLPHAPYLTMMAIGEFAEIKDKWQNIPVNYYVEPKDSADALLNFGNTPEMIGFFSEIFGYKYPWDKYHQVVVKDFVAGAMENTSAVIHANYVFRNKQQLIDMNFESIVAHELVHHWFGDLITCESWANLTLNEGFATYGQFLWADFKYGKTEGERELSKAKSKYLQDTPYKEIIRYHHDDSRELFDGHSYSKGALVLHQLRHHIGDEAFWEGLQYFLNKHAYQSVEIHDLRLAMEHVTGEDLNWFFNQWFLDKGHPILQVKTQQKNDTLIVNITQKQKSMGVQNFEFPMPISIYANGKKIDKEIFISKENENFYFPNVIEPDLVSVDPNHVICAEIIQKITPTQALFKYRNEKHYASRINALQQISKDTTMASFDLLSEAIKDKDADVRRLAMSEWAKIPDGKTEDFKEMLANIFAKDSSSAVRKSSIYHLVQNFPKDTVMIDLYKKALNDSSLQVKTEALKALFSLRREDALLRAAELEEIKDPGVILTLSNMYKDINDESKAKYYRWAINQTESAYKNRVIQNFREYLSRKGTSTMKKAVEELENQALYENNTAVREVAALAIYDLYKIHLKRIEDIEKDIKDKKSASKGGGYDLKMLEEKLTELQEKEKELKEKLKNIRKNEISASVKANWEKEGFTAEIFGN